MIKNFEPNVPQYKKKRSHDESDLQIKIADWIKSNYPDCLFTIAPNDIKLNIWQGKCLKRRGYRKGTLDFLILEPRGIFHGMFLEIKTSHGKETDEQKEFIKLSSERGYFAITTWGYDEAIKYIGIYLESHHILR